MRGQSMAKGRKKDKEKPVSSLIPGIIRDRGWQKQIELHSIFPHWKEVVDPDAAEHAVPLKIVRGVLWLEVENSAWLQQLQFQKVLLLEAINGFLKKSSIRDVRFVLPSGDAKDDKKDDRIRFIAPSPEEVKEFEKQVAFIEDEKVRESLIRFWYLSKACVRESDVGKNTTPEK